MNPLLPHLDPTPLPAPLALLWFFSILTFTLHLVPMSGVLGGSAIAAISWWRGRAGDSRHAALAHVIGKLLPVLIAAAVTLGVAALLFLQVLYGRVFFSSAIVMAWLWLAVVPLLIVAYYAAYGVAFSERRGGRAGLLLVVAGIALAIAFIYTNAMTLMLRPDAMHAFHASSASGVQLNTGDPMVAPRYLHMVAGSLAIAGLLVALLGFVKQRTDLPFGRWAIAYGARWFIAATIANLAIGTWHLAALPAGVAVLFLGQDLLATLLLAGGILTAAAAFGAMMFVAASPRPGRLLGWASLATLLTLVQMVLVRDIIRRTILGAAGLAPSGWVVPQWGPIIIFLVLLVVAIGLVGWMIAALVRPSAAASPEGVLPIIM